MQFFWGQTKYILGDVQVPNARKMPYGVSTGSHISLLKRYFTLVACGADGRTGGSTVRQLLIFLGLIDYYIFLTSNLWHANIY